jgi:hypothetical protein
LAVAVVDFAVAVAAGAVARFVTNLVIVVVVAAVAEMDYYEGYLRCCDRLLAASSMWLGVALRLLGKPRVGSGFEHGLPQMELVVD